MSEAEASLFEKERTVLVDSLADLNKRHEAVGPRLDKLQQELAAGKEKQVESGLVVWLLDLYRLLGEAVLIQARARLESVSVDPIELTPDDAMRTAMVNRLDVMNNRAALVDSWRLIAFNADALQSRLSVLADGNVSTDHDNALSFRAPTASLRMGVQFDPPFTRLLERNNYRQSLIDYERDRRDFIQYIDGVHRSLRQTLRDLEQLRLNLEIQRRAVAISIRRVDLTQEDLNKPVPPPEPGQPAAQLGPTASLNLLTALSDLRNTQNNFMSVWLNYYATRMRLVRDMGIMMLDNEGRWIDQSFSGPDDEGAEELDLPPTVPTEWYELLEVPAAEQPSTGNGDTTLREVSYQEP
jgi:outer membrane protein TolC